MSEFLTSLNEILPWIIALLAVDVIIIMLIIVYTELKD